MTGNQNCWHIIHIRNNFSCRCCSFSFATYICSFWGIVVRVKGTVVLTEANDGVCDDYLYLKWHIIPHVHWLRTMLHLTWIHCLLFFYICYFISLYEKSVMVLQLDLAISNNLCIYREYLQLDLSQALLYSETN